MRVASVKNFEEMEPLGRCCFAHVTSISCLGSFGKVFYRPNAPTYLDQAADDVADHVVKEMTADDVDANDVAVSDRADVM